MPNTLRQFKPPTLVARRSQPFHEIAYVPQYREFGLHFLVSGCAKVLRFCELPAEEVYFPSSIRGLRLPPEDELELKRKVPYLPASEVPKVSQFLREGLVRQATSMPMDIRVERELAERIPEHKGAQRAYLEMQVRDLEEAFDPAVEEVTPSAVHRASTGMSLAWPKRLANSAASHPGSSCSRVRTSGSGSSCAGFSGRWTLRARPGTASPRIPGRRSLGWRGGLTGGLRWNC